MVCLNAEELTLVFYMACLNYIDVLQLTSGAAIFEERGANSVIGACAKKCDYMVGCNSKPFK